MSGYLYWRSEPGLWTVGTTDPAGKRHPESDHDSPENAAARVAVLNGGPASPPAWEPSPPPANVPDATTYLHDIFGALEDIRRVLEDIRDNGTGQSRD